MNKIAPSSNRINPPEVKRFSDLGFDDTRERLDLLAIDKVGNLVIIENKLDDSGRDVVRQSLN